MDCLLASQQPTLSVGGIFPALPRTLSGLTISNGYVLVVCFSGKKYMVNNGMSAFTLHMKWIPYDDTVSGKLMATGSYVQINSGVLFCIS